MRSKLESFSLHCNSLASTDSSKIENVQRKSADLCCNVFLINIYTDKYDYIFGQVKFINASVQAVDLRCPVSC
jgi:hypothetical protein